MAFKKNRALILLVALLFVLAFLSFAIWKLNPNIVSLLRSKVPKGIFSSINNQNESSSSGKESSPSKYSIPSESFEKYIKSGLFGSEPTIWNWETSRIDAMIFGIDEQTKELTIKIDLPIGKTFSDVEKKVSAKCTPENTYKYTSGNLNFKESYVNIFDQRYITHSLITFCLDEVCDSIGKECIIIVND